MIAQAGGMIEKIRGMIDPTGVLAEKIGGMIAQPGGCLRKLGNGCENRGMAAQTWDVCTGMEVRPYNGASPEPPLLFKFTRPLL